MVVVLVLQSVLADSAETKLAAPVATATSKWEGRMFSDEAFFFYVNFVDFVEWFYAAGNSVDPVSFEISDSNM